MADKKKLFGLLQKQSEQDNNNARIISKELPAHDEIVKLISDRYVKSKTDRSYLDLVWRRAAAYYNGSQNIAIDKSRSTLVPLRDVLEYERMDTYNMIQPIIATKISLLNKYDYEPRVVPAGSSEEERANALKTTKLLKYIIRTENLNEKYLSAFLYAELYGCAVFKTFWDRDSGRAVFKEQVNQPDHESDESQETAKLPDGVEPDSPQKWEVQIKEGAPVIQVIPPYEIYPEHVHRPLSEQSWVIHATLLAPHEVFSRYGVWVAGTTNTVISSQDSGNFTDSVVDAQYTGTKSIDNTVCVTECWEMPSPQYPDGRFIVTTENTLLYYGAFPYKNSQDDPVMPFDVLMSQPSDGFFGDSTVSQLIPLQDSLNDCSNRIMDYIDRVCIGVWTGPEGSLSQVERLFDTGVQAGMWIPYKSGLNPPQQISTPSLPSEIFSMKSVLVSDMQRIAGLNELTMTASSSPYASGSMLMELAKAADTRMGSQYTRTRQLVCSIGSKILSLCRQYMVLPRFYEIVSPGGAEVDSGSVDLSALTSTSVVIEDEPETSLVQRQQNLQSLIQYGVFQPGAYSSTALEMIFELFDIGNGDRTEAFINEVKEAQAQQAQQAEQANQMQGE